VIINKAKVLIIDDDIYICRLLVKRFNKMDHEADYCLTLTKGLESLSTNEYDILFLDVNLPDGNGLEAISTIKDNLSAPEIIIMTGEDAPEGADIAIKARVWDYIQKSGSYKEFQFSLTRALEYRRQKQPLARKIDIKRESIIGKSRQIRDCLEKVLKTAGNDVPVLISGQTGTGKELFARAIHENSRRAKHNFIVVDCAALPEHLVESVLFGHAKGAFTSADSNKTGLIKLADKGTLFLDEVGELPIDIQKKFLRVLQEKQFRPVGSKNEISSNFRLIAATHRNLANMVEQKQLREDFYFRIASILIEIPPLKDRKPDIPLLVEHHMKRKTKLYNEPSHKVSQQFMEELMGYNWPGNVRELFNSLDYASSDAFRDSTLFPKHLPDHIRTFNIKNRIKQQKQSGQSNVQQNPCGPMPSCNTSFNKLSLKDHIETTKQKYITELWHCAQGDIKTACRLSGLSRGHLYALLKQYSIKTP